jgi:hypothetical protein
MAVQHGNDSFCLKASTAVAKTKTEMTKNPGHFGVEIYALREYFVLPNISNMLEI